MCAHAREGGAAVNAEENAVEGVGASRLVRCSSLSLWTLAETLDIVLMQNGPGRSSYHHEDGMEVFTLFLPDKSITLIHKLDAPDFGAVVCEEKLLGNEVITDRINSHRLKMMEHGPFFTEMCGESSKVRTLGLCRNDEVADMRSPTAED
jgi:hypothetical protein